MGRTTRNEKIKQYVFGKEGVRLLSSERSTPVEVASKFNIWVKAPLCGLYKHPPTVNKGSDIPT